MKHKRVCYLESISCKRPCSLKQSLRFKAVHNSQAPSYNALLHVNIIQYGGSYANTINH